jgi:hypothetical protein
VAHKTILIESTSKENKYYFVTVLSGKIQTFRANIRTFIINLDFFALELFFGTPSPVPIHQALTCSFLAKDNCGKNMLMIQQDCNGGGG